VNGQTSIASAGLLGGRLEFGFDGGVFALEVSEAAFAFDGLVVLFAHISLYFAFVFRFCVVTMVSRTTRFNIYLLLIAGLVAVAGCQSPETKREKQLATVRVHLEVGQGRPGQNLQVSVLRAAPMLINVERNPFLNEIHVASAKVEDTPGGFLLAIQLNQQGQWLLEQYTAANSNRRLAIRCQWGVPPDVQDRWLAAPLVTRRIKDGLLTFTPDATRDEAEQIAIGLNNLSRNDWLKDKPTPAPASGETK
jgi:hypothetical protein